MSHPPAATGVKERKEEWKNGREDASSPPRSYTPTRPHSRALSPIVALCRREVLKFVRERSRVAGALLQPLGLWLLLGLGFQGSFRLPGGGPDYLEFLFPGIVVMVLLFTSIFSTISVVEDRQTGFLQAVLTAPIPRATLALGHILGGTVLAVGQALLFLLLLPAVGLAPGLPGLGLALLLCVLTSLAFTALGFAIAWRMRSTRGYHSVMMLVLLPLWVLSGAAFPAAGAAAPLRWLMALNPVSYAVSGLRQALHGAAGAPVRFASPGVCLLVTAVFALAAVAAAAYIARRPLFRC